VAFSLVGILLGIILAGPLGKLLRPALSAVGIKNPVLLWVLGPVIVFVLISIIAKIAAMAVHQKVDVFYKYRAGDLRLALWERVNERVGLCLGLVNGSLYLVLISFVIYAMSYWTYQTSSGETDPWVIRRLNGLGQDLHSTGFDKVTRAIDPLPQSFFDSADLVGLIYNNSLLEARLQRYPAFLGLAERPEFADLANDKDFTEMWQRHEPVRNVMNYPKAQVILNNPDLLRTIWSTTIPDLPDLTVFLRTGKSPKYDAERILGRWDFDVNSAIGLYRKAKPNVSSSEMLKVKKWMTGSFSKTSFVATTDNQAILKNAPALKAAAPGASASGPQTFQGQWKNLDVKYQLTFPGVELPATVEGDKLTIAGEGGLAMVFNRED